MGKEEENELDRHIEIQAEPGSSWKPHDYSRGCGVQQKPCRMALF